MGKTLYEYCIETGNHVLLEQWHPTKNAELTPHNVTPSSHKKIYWRCADGHEWQSVVYARTAGHGCPVCARGGQPIAPTLAEKTPHLVKEWHPTKNLSLTPNNVAPYSERRVWWKCERGHEWEAKIKTRVVRGVGCPVCANRVVVAGDNDLATAHPEIAAEWHPGLNGDLTPKMFPRGSKKKAWWICEKGHVWEARIALRVSGAGCPVCTGRVVIPGENDFASAFPELAAQWHPTKNEGLSPQDVTQYSNKKVWWVCEKGHEYQAIVASRTRDKKGCPFCTSRRILLGFNDLATTQPKIAAQWHPELNGELTPQMVTAGSNKRAWWICAEGHVWNTRVSVRTGKRKHGCPVCSGHVSEKRQARYEEMVKAKK